MRRTNFIAAMLAVFLTLAAPALAGMETVRVLVAKQALSYGTTLQPGNLQWVEWPKAAVPPGAFTSVEELLGEKGDQKRFVLSSIEPGEPVVESKITKFGASPLMLMNLGAGMRSVSIKIDAVSAVAGFVAAGDRVDILLTRTQEGQLLSSVILPDITVIAVDHRTNSEAASPQFGHTVIVEVDTIQAQKLALAQQVGRLSLTLRGIGETSDAEPGDAGDATEMNETDWLDIDEASWRRAPEQYAEYLKIFETALQEFKDEHGSRINTDWTLRVMNLGYCKGVHQAFLVNATTDGERAAVKKFIKEEIDDALLDMIIDDNLPAALVSLLSFAADSHRKMVFVDWRERSYVEIRREATLCLFGLAEKPLYSIGLLGDIEILNYRMRAMLAERYLYEPPSEPE